MTVVQDEPWPKVLSIEGKWHWNVVKSSALEPRLLPEKMGIF